MIKVRVSVKEGNDAEALPDPVFVAAAARVNDDVMVGERVGKGEPDSEPVPPILFDTKPDPDPVDAVAVFDFDPDPETLPVEEDVSDPRVKVLETETPRDRDRTGDPDSDPVPKLPELVALPLTPDPVPTALKVLCAEDDPEVVELAESEGLPDSVFDTGAE